MKRALAAVLGVALGACAPQTAGPACRNPAAGLGDLGVGTKASGFVAVHDGDVVPVIQGPVGPPILLVSMRLTGFELPEVDQALSMRVAIRFNGRLIGGTVAPMHPATPTGPSVDLVGAQALFNVADAQVFLDGTHTCDVTAELSDACGRTVVATRKLRFRR